MLVQFRSPATETITMFGEAAVQLLKLMGATGRVPGGLSAEDVPPALQRLESAVEGLKTKTNADTAARPADNEDTATDEDTDLHRAAADPAGNAGRAAAEPVEARRGGQSDGDLGGQPLALTMQARLPEGSLMGRIFEVRKHTMFARWNRMAKQFARIGKDITIAVKSGGTDPNSNPAPAPRDPERARRQHAEGQGRGRDQARLGQGRRELRRGPLRRLRAARRGRAGGNRHGQPDAHRRQRAQRLHQARRQPRHQRQRQLPCSRRWACSA